MSHAMPIVTKTNEMPAKANPTTYQMPVNRTPFERRAGVHVADRRLRAEGAAIADRPGQPPSAILPAGTEGAANRRWGSPWGRLGSGSGARRARVQFARRSPYWSYPTDTKTDGVPSVPSI